MYRIPAFPLLAQEPRMNQDSPAAGAKLEAGGWAPKFDGGAEPAAVESNL